MKSTDFRIGNLVYYHIEDKMDEREAWDEVSPIDYDDLRCFEQYEDNSEYRPILLNEEWLLKTGCDKKEDYFELDRFRLRWMNPYKYFYVTDVHSGGYFTKLEFVHEWQNFYFILQGEELTINLK